MNNPWLYEVAKRRDVVEPSPPPTVSSLLSATTAFTVSSSSSSPTPAATTTTMTNSFVNNKTTINAATAAATTAAGRAATAAAASAGRAATAASAAASSASSYDYKSMLYYILDNVKDILLLIFWKIQTCWYQFATFVGIYTSSSQTQKQQPTDLVFDVVLTIFVGIILVAIFILHIHRKIRARALHKQRYGNATFPPLAGLTKVATGGGDGGGKNVKPISFSRVTEGTLTK